MDNSKVALVEIFFTMFPFENLQVYQKAFGFNRQILKYIGEHTNLPFYLKNQLGRASLSIVLNIAEGSAKYSKKDRRNFYIIARGSAFETASIISLLAEENKMAFPIQVQLSSVLKEISLMLYSLINNLEKQLPQR